MSAASSMIIWSNVSCIWGIIPIFASTCTSLIDLLVFREKCYLNFYWKKKKVPLCPPGVCVFPHPRTSSEDHLLNVQQYKRQTAALNQMFWSNDGVRIDFLTAKVPKQHQKYTCVEMDARPQHIIAAVFTRLKLHRVQIQNSDMNFSKIKDHCFASVMTLMSSLGKLSFIWHVVPPGCNHTWCISSSRGCFFSCFEWVWSTLHAAFALQALLVYPLVPPHFYWGSTCTPIWKWPYFDGLHAENDLLLGCVFLSFFFHPIRLNSLLKENRSPRLYLRTVLQ